MLPFNRKRSDRLALIPHLLLTLFLANAIVGSTAHGQTVAIPEGINDAFLDPDLNVDEWLARFEVESREVYHSRNAIIDAIDLKPGDRIADIGTGTGLFVSMFAKAVGNEGWVFAIDIAPKFVQRVGNIATDRKLKNVTPVLGGFESVRLPADSIDVGFLCDVYHHFETPAESLRSIHTAIRPGGRLILIDFERIEGVSREFIIGHVRAGKETFRDELERVGFVFESETSIDGFEENYFLTFRRP